MLIDSHCHLTVVDNLSVKSLVEEAYQAGVTQMVNVSIDLESWPSLVESAEKHPEVWLSAGLHPTHAPGDALDVGRLRDMAQHPKVVAVGESGLDYYRSSGDMAWQQRRFREHIRLARELSLPLIVHTRHAKADTLRLLREEGATQGVLHCFTEDQDMAEAAIELGFAISFSGILTFKNAQPLREVVQALPLEHIWVETDAPYLAPVPYRGQTNRPAYVVEVAKQVAALKGVSFEKVAQQTTANVRALFSKMAVTDSPL